MDSSQNHSQVPRKWQWVSFCRGFKGNPIRLLIYFPPVCLLPASNQGQACILAYLLTASGEEQRCSWVKQTCSREWKHALVISQEQQLPASQEFICPWASEAYRLTLVLREDWFLWVHGGQPELQGEPRLRWNKWTLDTEESWEHSGTHLSSQYSGGRGRWILWVQGRSALSTHRVFQDH